MTLQLAVVGAGVMGANHCRIAASLPGVSLVGVVDADHDRAEAASAAGGCRGSVPSTSSSNRHRSTQ